MIFFIYLTSVEMLSGMGNLQQAQQMTMMTLILVWQAW